MSWRDSKLTADRYLRICPGHYLTKLKESPLTQKLTKLCGFLRESGSDLLPTEITRGQRSDHNDNKNTLKIFK